MIVNLKKPGLIALTDKVSLKPGPNTIDLELWKQFRTHPIIKIHLEEGVIVEEQDFDELAETGDSKEGELDHLKSLKIPQAKQLVEETTNLELLNGWMEREDRNQVKSALKKQIEKLTEPAEKRDRSQTRQIVTGRGPEVVEVSVTPNASDD